jgi:hypothetical protein
MYPRYSCLLRLCQNHRETISLQQTIFLRLPLRQFPSIFVQISLAVFSDPLLH